MAFAGCCSSGILKGVLIAAVASILLLLHRAANPHVAFLGRIPGTRRFSDLARHPDNERIAGVLAFRVEASLLYFNVEHVLDTVLERVRCEDRRPALVICDLSTSPYVDLAGARMLRTLAGELAERGMAFRVTDARGGTRDLLRDEGLEAATGRIDRVTSVADVVDEIAGA